MFICNHCPYVKAIEKRLVELHAMFKERSVSMVAISANDALAMTKTHLKKEEQGLSVPYLYDESQDVATAFGAVALPIFFSTIET